MKRDIVMLTASILTIIILAVWAESVGELGFFQYVGAHVLTIIAGASAGWYAADIYDYYKDKNK